MNEILSRLQKYPPENDLLGVDFPQNGNKYDKR